MIVLFRSLRSTVVLAAAASSWAVAQQTSAGIELRPRWCTTGSAGSHEFLSITGAIELANGMLWVSDPRASSIVEVGADGATAKVVVKPGDGPGEVRSPYTYVRWSDGLFGVYDAQPSSLELFSSAGRFLRRVSLGARVVNVKGMVALSGRRLLMSGGIAGNAYSVHLFDSTGALIRSFHPAPVTKNPRAGVMVAGGALSVDADGVVWFSQAAPHQILRLDPGRGGEEPFAADAELLAAVGDDFIREETVNGQVVRSFKWFFPQSRTVFRTGRQLVNVIWRHDENRSLWEIYDIGSRRRMSVTEVPFAYLVLSQMRNGDLVTTHEDAETGQATLCRLKTPWSRS